MLVSIEAACLPKFTLVRWLTALKIEPDLSLPFYYKNDFLLSKTSCGGEYDLNRGDRFAESLSDCLISREKVRPKTADSWVGMNCGGQ